MGRKKAACKVIFEGRLSKVEGWFFSEKFLKYRKKMGCDLTTTPHFFIGILLMNPATYWHLP